MDVVAGIGFPLLALGLWRTATRGTESNALTDASLTDAITFTQEYGEYDREDRDTYEDKEWGDKSGGTAKEREDLAKEVGGNIEERNKAKGLSIIPLAPYVKRGNGKKVNTFGFDDKVFYN